MNRVILRAFLGGIAGILAWAIVEPFKPDVIPALGTIEPAWLAFEAKLRAALGLAIGAALGYVSGYLRGSKQHAIKELGLGALFGFLGMFAGTALASPFHFVLAIPIVGRTAILTIIGIGLGFGIGMTTLNLRRGIQGAIGGAIGGAVAGALFDTVSSMLGTIILSAQGKSVGEVGAPGRAIYGVMLGMGIGMALGLIELIQRSAWIQLLMGRNEGKQWPLDKDVMNIGRDERADIPLFGDGAVGQLHFRIVKSNKNWFADNNGLQHTTLINGHPLQGTMPLQDNSQIVIGNTHLRFVLKAAPVPKRGQEAVPVAYSLSPHSGNAPSAQIQPGFHPQAVPISVQQQPYAPQQGAAPATTGVPAAPLGITAIRVTCVSGSLTGQTFSLSLPTDLGRECPAIPMGDNLNASRKHARIEMTPAGLVLVDLQSTNGTLINGAKITTASLRPGDIFSIGSAEFRVEQ